MIKSLKKNDIRTTPFTATKKWNPQNKLHKDLILWQSGSVSGSLSLTFKEFNDGTIAPYTYISSAIALQQQEDDFLRFRDGVNLSGSMSPTGSFYYDPVLSEKNIDGTYKTVLYATTKHLFYNESQDPSKIFGLESLDSSNVDRSLPNRISTFNIPQNKFGEKVLPKSVVIRHEIQGQTYNVVDDGNSNLVVSDKTFINNQDTNIDKVAASIVLDGFDKNNKKSISYNGSSITVTATTSPSNLSYIVTYNGSRTPPKNVGVYEVVATIDDNFYTGTITGILTIKKLSATINISNLNQTYDGSPKYVTVSIPSVSNYTVTYNSSKSAPTNAGTYDVNVTVVDPNYEGSKSAQLIIAASTLSITTQCPSKTYGDPDFTIPVNTISNGGISYTINSGPAIIKNGKISITGVGTINVTITQAKSGNYSAASVNCSSITVSAKPLIVTGITASDKVEDGNTNATLNTSNAQLQGIIGLDVVTLTGVASGTFSNSSAGEGKTVTITGLSLTGTSASKYTLVQPTTTASIKATSGSGTITMNSATVVYNGNPQSLTVTVDSNIPIKVTYRNGNNIVITSVKLYKGITTIPLGQQYPKDIGIYNVTAELDTSVSTVVKYTVSTVTATLNIKSIQGNVTFGPNIFYYNGNPCPVQILSQSPVGKDLTITYNGSSTVPSAVGIYDVNVKFKDPNIYFDKTVKLTIKNIPTNSCGSTIQNETKDQQYQKNIINLTSATGKVNFIYNVGLGASQFKIEYPLNSGTNVYDSGLRSGEYKIGTSVTDYISGESLTVSGIQNPTNNTPISFDKNQKGINVNNGQDGDKCLVTVYSPTNNNTWNYSVSCIDVAPTVIQPRPGIDDLGNVRIELNYSFGHNNITAEGTGLGVLLLSLKPQLQAERDGGSITQYEYNVINRILDTNVRIKGPFGVEHVWRDSAYSNIGIIVGKTGGGGEPVEVFLKYQRVSDSLVPLINNIGSLAYDCHMYKYKGNKVSFDLQDAKSILIQQIQSDTFKNIFQFPNVNLTNGEIQRQIVISFVNNLTSEDTDLNLYIITDELSNRPNSIYESTISQQLRTLIYYVNTSKQEIGIVYPAICQPINFGQFN